MSPKPQHQEIEKSIRVASTLLGEAADQISKGALKIAQEMNENALKKLRMANDQLKEQVRLGDKRKLETPDVAQPAKRQKF